MNERIRVPERATGLRKMPPERLALYRFLMPAVEGRQVLLVGFGSGHGAELLAERAERVVAVEDRAVLVSSATARFSRLRERLTFAQLGEGGLPYSDASFDVVCCFELERWGESLEETRDELRRVLRPDGLLVVSGSELAAVPLRSLLEPRFDATRVFEQSSYRSESFAELLSEADRRRSSDSQAFVSQSDAGSFVESGWLGPSAAGEARAEGTRRGVVAVAGPSPEAMVRLGARLVHRPAEESGVSPGGEEPSEFANPFLVQTLRDAEAQRYQATLKAELWEQASAMAGELRRELLAAAVPPPLEAETGTYDLLVPTYNNPEITARCLDSLLANTDHRHRLYIVDDASPDPRMAPLLSAYAERFPHVHYERLPQNLGFPGAVNTGLARTEHDVVLINSDTEFPPSWLGRLERCRRSDKRIAAVSPLSNNATICSVPKLNEKNVLPEGMDVESMDRLVQSTSLRRYPRAPTVVGFCMLMTREALDAIGQLDTLFGRGYGEEVDWCQRAWAQGFECALCDDLYVYHHGEVGFSHVSGRKELQQANERKLAERWPSYHRHVETYCLTNPLRLQQQRLFAALEPQGSARHRVLHVVHSYDARGGTERFVRGLVEGLRERLDSTVYSPLGLPPTIDALLRETSGVKRVHLNVQTFPMEYSIRGALVSLRSRNAERLFAEVVLGSGAEVVHFSHLANLGSLALPLVAKALGTKVVVVLHDYYLLCPDWNLATEERRACGRARVTPEDPCLGCMSSRAQIAPTASTPSWPALLRERDALCRAAAEAADVLVAPSKFVKEQFRRAWGDGLADRIVVIPHGTDPLETPVVYYPQPELRVAFLGNATLEKGRDVFFEAARALQGSKVRWRVLGALGPDGSAPPGNVAVHGPYDPSELPRLLSDVDVVVIASTWHETYCYTVDEAFRAGVPVIGTSMGAIQERIRHGQTGLLVPPSDADALAAAVRRLDEDRELLARLRRGVAELALKSRQENIEEYAELLTPQRARDLHAQLIRQGMLQNARIAVPPQQPLAAMQASSDAVPAAEVSAARGLAQSNPQYKPKRGKKRVKARRGR